jgi:putative serine protease PepD
MSVKGPRHLWTGDWRSDSRHNADSLDAIDLPPPRTDENGAEPEQELPEARPRRPRAEAVTPARARAKTARRRAGAIAAIVVVAAAAAFAAGSLTSGGGGQTKTAAPATPLPAFDAQPLKPRKGQTRAGAVYALAAPAVVSVRASGDSGSGFLIDSDGTIVTNAHVVNGEHTLVVRFGQDGRAITAQLLGQDESTDLAALKIPSSAIPNGVKPLRFADSRNVRVGDVAIAIGNPFDLDRSATEGIVSALGRSIEAPNRFTIDNVIQTDAPINPGNSGGPLLNDSGLVIGVNAQIQTGGGQGNVGIGFAIPSNTVRQVLPIIEKGERVQWPYMGVESAPTDPGEPSGAKIASVTAGGPAERAGIQPGDVIVSVGGKKVPNFGALSQVISRFRAGDRVAVVVDRGGHRETIEVTLGVRPNQP